MLHLFLCFDIHKSNQRKQKSHRDHFVQDTMGKKHKAGQKRVEGGTLERDSEGAVGRHLRFQQLLERVSKQQKVKRREESIGISPQGRLNQDSLRPGLDHTENASLVNTGGCWSLMPYFS